MKKIFKIILWSLLIIFLLGFGLIKYIESTFTTCGCSEDAYLTQLTLWEEYDEFRIYGDIKEAYQKTYHTDKDLVFMIVPKDMTMNDYYNGKYNGSFGWFEYFKDSNGNYIRCTCMK